MTSRQPVRGTCTRYANTDPLRVKALTIITWCVEAVTALTRLTVLKVAVLESELNKCMKVIALYLILTCSFLRWAHFSKSK